MKKSCQATLLSKGPGGAWTYFVIPFDVREAFGTQGRLAVKGLINEIPFRTSIMPEGDGTHFMMFNKELQAQTTAGAGDTVSVVLEADRDVLDIAAPAELEAAFRASPQASAFVDALIYSQKKDYSAAL